MTAVGNIRNRFAYILEEKGIHLEFSEFPSSILVSGDEARIEQVLYNFVNNACNHTAKGGIIRIEISENADNVKIEVIDNGKGIPSEELPYIWDRFYKVSADSKGTGLGLAIAKKILEAHKSGYGVESEPGQGSDFWFTLGRP
jgi:signal transduction histidine kinase